MYETPVINPVTIEAIKNQDDSLTFDQCTEIFEYLKKTRDLTNGLKWTEILRAINIYRSNWKP